MATYRKPGLVAFSFHLLFGLASTMRLEHGRRASLALTLNFVAFAFALSAVTTSYWCEGTRKVVKPFCTGPPVKVKQWFCIRFNSSNINDSRLVQYIFETGEEKFLLKKFHTGIFFSCEQAADMNGKTVSLSASARCSETGNDDGGGTSCCKCHPMESMHPLVNVCVSIFYIIVESRHPHLSQKLTKHELQCGRNERSRAAICLPGRHLMSVVS